MTLALLFVGGTYSAAPLGDFVWDDVALILEQPSVRELQPISSYFDRMFFGGPQGAPTRAFYRPLVNLSFALDWQLWGGSPMGFHLANVLLHLLSVGLVFALARRWGARPLPAALAASLFGTLPRLTEAVAWISGRTDLLATVFVLAALLVHRQRAVNRWMAATCLLLGLFSKEVAIAGFAAALLLELRWARAAGEGGLRLVRRLVPLLASGLVYASLRLHAQLGADAPARAPELGVGRRISAALEAMGSYTWMFLDPLRPRTQIGSVWVEDGWMIALGIVALLVGTWLAFHGWRRARDVGGGGEGTPSPRPLGLITAALVLVPLALVSHLVPVALQVVAADRFLYLPAAALAIGAAVALPRLSSRATRPLSMGAALLIPLFAGASYLRVSDWQDEVTLWSEAVEHAPAGNSLPFVQLGIALTRAGKPELADAALERAEAIDEALHRERGIGDGMGSGAREARALALAAMGRFDEAAAIFEALAQARPNEPTYPYNAAVVRAMGLDFEGAEQRLQMLLGRYPDFDDARQLLAEVRENAKRWASLPAPTAEEATRLRLERAEIFRAIGREGEARRIWRELLDSPAATSEERARAAARLGSGG